MTLVLIPWSDVGDPDRARALRYVADRYERLSYEPVVVGYDEAPWSKGEALRPFWDGLREPVIVSDSDCLVSRRALLAAVGAVEAGAPWAAPHSTTTRLDARTTRVVYETGRIPRRIGKERATYPAMLGGGIVVLSPDAWARVPPDPRFYGWGGEDEAWGLALSTLAGRPVVVPTELLHLYHAHAAPRRRRRRWPERDESTALLLRYREARDDPAALDALVGEYRDATEPGPSGPGSS